MVKEGAIIMRFKIGNIEIANQVVLAPMAGISNPAYMKICEEMGCGYAITELISAEAIVRDNKKTLDMLNGIDKLTMPVGVQLFGANADTLANAAKKIVELYPVSFIDINMGCPVPKVAVSAGAGSSLLKSPEKVREIVQKVVSSVSVPVTVKIRSGWDSNSINAVEIAKICESAGASAIAVHPRTRSQGYSGLSDWNIIKDVKENVSIPVIGNGDILSCYDAKRMLEETNCDAVMIGRAALGNPWIIKECVDYLDSNILPKEVMLHEKIAMIKYHLTKLMETKPYKVAMLEIRTHAAWYLKGLPKGQELKQEIFLTTKEEELLSLLDSYEKEMERTLCELKE